MMENKQLKDEELGKVVGGIIFIAGAAPSADVKCEIKYLDQGKLTTAMVTLSVKATDNKISSSDIEDAAKNWCTQLSYEYVSYQAFLEDSFFVVY